MSDSSKEQILALIRKMKEVSSTQLVEQLGISRQMVARHLSDLTFSGQLEKTGSTRSARYKLLKKGSQKERGQEISLRRELMGLREDDVFAEVDLRLNLKRELSSDVYNIAYYAFTEMLNNAIDHSKSRQAVVSVTLNERYFSFHVKDRGIGLFENVKQSFDLNDEYQGLEHVVKGKQTTFPEAHSGQGIFFTSRISDIFEISSHSIVYRINNSENEKIVGEIKNIVGTDIFFQIKRRTRKKLYELFHEYANEDFEFDRSDVRVQLRKNMLPISRSQARRLLSGLEKYKLVTLDFKNVKEVGQGFIDETFHVFKKRHPEIQVIYQNANSAVEFMILRVGK